MAMPETLVLVRHGLSEANIVQRLEGYVYKESLLVDEKTGDYEVKDPTIQAFVDKYIGAYALRDEIYSRPDYQQRLSYEGVEQAKIAGDWLRENLIAPEDFDERYASPFHRTMDTAIALGGPKSKWLADFRIVERDWGIYGATPRDKRPDMFPHTEKAKDDASFYVRYDNGESILDSVMRVRDWTDTLTRDNSDSTVLAVAHGEIMWAERVNIERLLPQEFHALDGDKSLRIGNCCLLIYDRKNPEDPEQVERSLSKGWMRMIDPVEPEKSPYGGEWQKLQGKRRFTSVQLQEFADQTPRILPVSF